MIYRYTILYVADVAASLAFYEAAFGLETGFLHDAGDYGELITGDTKLAFSSRALMHELGKTPRPADPKAPDFELAFETNDVEADYAKAVAAGAAPQEPPVTQSWGQVTSYVSDPDGYLIEICSPIASPG